MFNQSGNGCVLSHLCHLAMPLPRQNPSRGMGQVCKTVSWPQEISSRSCKPLYEGQNRPLSSLASAWRGLVQVTWLHLTKYHKTIPSVNLMTLKYEPLSIWVLKRYFQMQSSYKSIGAILLFLWNPKLFPSSQDRSFACAKSPLLLRIHPTRPQGASDHRTPCWEDHSQQARAWRHETPGDSPTLSEGESWEFDEEFAGPWTLVLGRWFSKRCRGQLGDGICWWWHSNI